ncbi:hypothetical protein BHE74_00034597, partial [Ensete ventricosum]
FSTLRTENFKGGASEQGLPVNLNLVEERRAKAHLHTLEYQRAIARLYNRKVWPQSVDDDNLVLRKAEVSDPRHTRGKLAPNWEGPYQVICTLPRTWHISNMKKFYI